ncbi:MAG: hypothetical protein ACRDTA_19435 [Pseudonocardiaceae bacterium]
MALVLLADLRGVLARLSRQRESTQKSRPNSSFAHHERPTQ